MNAQDYKHKKRRRRGNVDSSEPNIDTLTPKVDSLEMSADECFRRLQVVAEELDTAFCNLKRITSELSESLDALSAVIANFTAEVHLNIPAK